MYWEIINYRTGQVLTSGWRTEEEAWTAFNEMAYSDTPQAPSPTPDNPRPKAPRDAPCFATKVWSGDPHYWEHRETPIP